MRVYRLLENAPADRAWRRRGLMVLCRTFPGRMHLDLLPRAGGGADSGTHGAVSSTAEPLSNRRRRLDDPAASDGSGGRSGGGSGGGSEEQAEGGSGGEMGEIGGWNSALAAWVLGTGEEAIFRNIVLFL